MSTTTDLGSQFIGFDFRHKLQAKEFNKLWYDVFDPGIYSGGTLTKNATLDTVDITPFSCIILSDTDKVNYGKTTQTINYKPSGGWPASGTYSIYLLFDWADTVDNYISFNITNGAIPPRGLKIGEVILAGSAVSSVSETGRILGTNKTQYFGEINNLTTTVTSDFVSALNELETAKAELSGCQFTGEVGFGIAPVGGVPVSINGTLRLYNGSDYASIIPASVLQIYNNIVSGTSSIRIDPKPLDLTSPARLDLFNTTETSGVVQARFFRGDNSSTIDHRISSGNQQCYFNGNGLPLNGVVIGALSKFASEQLGVAGDTQLRGDVNMGTGGTAFQFDNTLTAFGLNVTPESGVLLKTNGLTSLEGGFRIGPKMFGATANPDYVYPHIAAYDSASAEVGAMLIKLPTPTTNTMLKGEIFLRTHTQTLIKIQFGFYYNAGSVPDILGSTYATVIGNFPAALSPQIKMGVNGGAGSEIPYILIGDVTDSVLAFRQMSLSVNPGYIGGHDPVYANPANYEITVEATTEPSGLSAVNFSQYGNDATIHGQLVVSTGGVDVTGNSTFNNNLTVTGVTNLNGAVNLGDASGDTITFNGTLAGNVQEGAWNPTPSGTNISSISILTNSGKYVRIDKTLILSASFSSGIGDAYAYPGYITLPIPGGYTLDADTAKKTGSVYIYDNSGNQYTAFVSPGGSTSQVVIGIWCVSSTFNGGSFVITCKLA